MPRPPKCRLVQSLPGVVFFKPQGVPLSLLTEVRLTHDGFEALRLVDVEGLDQGQAAARMNVSRQTLGRILAGARKAVALAVVNGLALRIEGGHVAVGRQRQCQATVPAAPGQGRGEATPGQESIAEGVMKKIAVSAEGPGLEARVDPRFGRAAGFVLVDPATMAHEYLDNGASQALGQGAGIQAAETVVRARAKVVLTGVVGPKAFQALKAAGVDIGQELEGLSVREAVERYLAGRVDLAAPPAGPGGRRS